MTKVLAALLLSIATAFAWASEFTGRVVGVTDGDTITVLDAANQQHKVRLSGIDTPEKGQPFGQVAKQSLSDQVFDRQVIVETSKIDKYGRAIGKVKIGGTDINLEMIKRGLAWHFKRYQNEQPLDERLSYGAAENEARAASKGLWADSDPIPPWAWRKRKN